MNYNFKEISQLLAQRAEDVCRMLLPNGKKEGNYWKCGSTSGEKGESLSVTLFGEYTGKWKDWATNENGDLLDLFNIRYFGSKSIIDASSEACRYLGISKPKLIAHKKEFTKPNSLSTFLQDDSIVYNYLIEKRMLSSETLGKYGVGERGNEIVFNFWRNHELILVKYLSLNRPNGKKIISTEKDCEPCLFGWNALPKNTRSIFICEGEIDAMSLYEYGYAALSVPFGATNLSWIETEFDRISMFDEIYLIFDPDEAGNAGLYKIIERLGRHRCRIVRLPCKDANECLQKGVTKEEIKKCFDEAESLDPEELKNAKFFSTEVIDLFYPPNGIEVGYTAPWERMQGKILFRPDELSIFTGINGHGKSMLLGHILLSAMQQGAKVCIASLEIKPRRLLFRLIRQVTTFEQPSPEYINTALDWLNDKLWLFDLTGTAKTEKLLDVFDYARKRYGVDIFVIDSMMKLDVSEDDYNSQKAAMEKLCDFKNEHNCHIFLVVHPRKREDESQPPGKLDVKGSGSIVDMADNCFSVWRNKLKEQTKRFQEQRVLSRKEEDALSEPDCVVTCSKNRNGDFEGRFGLWFDSTSYQYLDFEAQKPKPFLEYSQLKT
jgi:twinkle protein